VVQEEVFLAELLVSPHFCEQSCSFTHILALRQIDLVGEFDFRKDVPSFSSTKGGRYFPLEEENNLF
jgi:hypothetical protein